jgi:hypothetical protein
MDGFFLTHGPVNAAGRRYTVIQRPVNQRQPLTGPSRPAILRPCVLGPPDYRPSAAALHPRQTVEPQPLSQSEKPTLYPMPYYTPNPNTIISKVKVTTAKVATT